MKSDLRRIEGACNLPEKVNIAFTETGGRFLHGMATDSPAILHARDLTRLIWAETQAVKSRQNHGRKKTFTT